MNKLTDMVVAAVEEKPDDFKTAFEATLQDVIGQHIAAYKLQIQQGMLGIEEEVPEEAELTEEEVEAAFSEAVEEYLTDHPDETEEQAAAAILAELEADEELKEKFDFKKFKKKDKDDDKKKKSSVDKYLDGIGSCNSPGRERSSVPCYSDLIKWAKAAQQRKNRRKSV